MHSSTAESSAGTCLLCVQPFGALTRCHCRPGGHAMPPALGRPCQPGTSLPAGQRCAARHLQARAGVACTMLPETTAWHGAVHGGLVQRVPSACQHSPGPAHMHSTCTAHAQQMHSPVPTHMHGTAQHSTTLALLTPQHMPHAILAAPCGQTCQRMPLSMWLSSCWWC